MRVRRKTADDVPGKLTVADLEPGDLFATGDPDDDDDDCDVVYMMLDENDRGAPDRQLVTDMNGTLLRFKPDTPVRRRDGELVLADA